MEGHCARTCFSDGCNLPRSSSSLYHLRPPCSLSPSNTVDGYITQGVSKNTSLQILTTANLNRHQDDLVKAQNEPDLDRQEKGGRADKVRAGAKSLHPELSEEIISKMCASDDDLPPVKESLLFVGAGNSQEGGQAGHLTTGALAT